MTDKHPSEAANADPVLDLRGLLHEVADISADFYGQLPSRPVFPMASIDDLRNGLDVPLGDEGAEVERVIRELVAGADPGIVASPGGRYFGFVIGGSLPAALAADWLTSVWDQNAGLYACGPAASIVEEVAGGWLLELLGLPPDASFGFVTGGQMANWTALAAARHHVLGECGWDVEKQGLVGAPSIRTIVGEKRHGTIDRSLRFLGLGEPTDILPADKEGRMRLEGLELDDRPTIVCAQAGEVNTGCFDEFQTIADACSGAANAWLHVDGAIGLWAAASPHHSRLVRGLERADSWSTDAHKLLNVPYDSGLVFCAQPSAHSAAISAGGSYLVFGESERDEIHWNPEHSRRARGFSVYAALRSLGRDGLVSLIDRSCERAQALAAGLEDIGAEVLNDIVFNQVLFRFADDQVTEDVLSAVQRSGEAWMGGTSWDGRLAIRLSVSNWLTSADDVGRTVEAFRVALRESQR
jgi:glutamate/tyrosine decarboxylase-like PLP-dependent enzyme